MFHSSKIHTFAIHAFAIRAFVRTLCLALVAGLLSPLLAQTAPARFLGTVSAINGSTLSVKTDTGDVKQVQVPATAVLKQIAPGEKDLRKAEEIPYSSLATGDRVLVRLDTSGTDGSMVALQIIAIKQADLAKKQAADQMDWQRRGVGGLVKSVDPATGVIVVTSGAGSATKTITIHTTPSSVLKRYAADSVRFDEARPAPISAIKAGDQIRARGDKSPDGLEVTAEDAVSGSFRNVAGQVISVDAANSTVIVKDLATKKPVTIRVTPESQLKKLPDTLAARLAQILKGEGGGFAGRIGQGAPAGGPGGPGGPGAGGMRGSGFDPQMLLNRAPGCQLGDLKKGDAVMLVTTDGGANLTAITLLAGVEPLLEAPAASNLLSNWSMGSSSGGEMGQ